MKLLFYSGPSGQHEDLLHTNSHQASPLFQLIYNCRVKEVQQTGDCLMKGTQVLVPPRSTTTLYCIVSPI